MLVKNESDLEIIHSDGTITSKIDGVRRSYQDHVAFHRGLSVESLPDPTQGSLGRFEGKRVYHPVYPLKLALVASCGTVFGFIGGIIAQHVHL